jgi:hypothetical protein
MPLMPRLPLAVLGLVVSASALPAEDPAERYARGVRAEDETARKLTERIQKPGDSERERWFKKLDEVYTGRVADDPDQWFDLVTHGRSEWTRDGSRYFAEFHDRVGERFGLTKADAIGRDTFASYARRYLGPDSPPWKTADVTGEARGPFKLLDADRDGHLSPDECSPGLRDRFSQADTNGDGRIDLSEYQAYFRARVEYEVRTTVPPDEKQKEEQKLQDQMKEQLTKAEADERAAKTAGLYRDPARLPKELPAWFRQYDTDGDLQVALYEWREAKRSVAEFEEMDLNGDGLLEVGEYLRYAKLKAERGERPAELRASLPEGKKAMK